MSTVRLVALNCIVSCLFAQSVWAIMAGGEFSLPADTPSGRIDPLSSGSSTNFVGALGIDAGGSNYFGSGSALSQHWVLTAGHNVDFNDNGVPDAGLGIDFYLPGFGSYSATSYVTNPNFGGFGNPTIHNDLALLYFEDALPSLAFPALGLSMGLDDTFILAGFGRSGYGSYGYTTDASLTDRRLGQNVVDSFEQESGGAGLLFRYDFDAPGTFGTVGGSLGNTVETLIAPGDSGGAALLDYAGGLALVGVNTFTEGYGGLFGDIGGGVALDPYWGWISETTGLSLVPEPSQSGMLAGLLALVIVSLRRGR